MIIERAALERRVMASLDAGRIPVVLGGCGTGRTSLLLRVAQHLSSRAQYVDLAAIATTPERCLTAAREVTTFQGSSQPAVVDSPRSAFDGLLSLLDSSRGASGDPVTFLIDEVIDIRTFESFPGLRNVQRELIERLAVSQNAFVLASRFTARTHRILRDAPARFEVIHVPSCEAHEVQALARSWNGPQEWSAEIAPNVVALAGGRAAYIVLLIEALSSMGPAIDPVAALASLMSPDGRLRARCRESYEFRLHRARGYGALKAIMGILAAQEPLTLTEIAQQLHRTPGSTKDYLSWLEDVDLITAERKRYRIEDPLVRLFTRLYSRAVPPTDAELVREIRSYAQARLSRPVSEAPASLPQPVAAPKPSPAPALATAERQTSDTAARSGIIEID